LELRTELGDRSGMATCWGVLGNIERNRGNWDEAERLYRQSLELRQNWAIALVWQSQLVFLEKLNLGRDNLDAAEKLLTDALERFRNNSKKELLLLRLRFRHDLKFGKNATTQSLPNNITTVPIKSFNNWEPRKT
jgi:tetratricopeptide (TPR) repeat protein